MTPIDRWFILPTMNVIPDVLTLDDACEYLQVSRNTLDKFIKEQGLPVVILGARNPRIITTQLQEWLEGRSVTKEEK